jgi:YjbE family integral membrane protein
MDFWSELSAFAQIVLIDLTMSGENAIVVGVAAAGLPSALRHRAIMIGIVAATVLRIVLAIFTVQLLKIIGLMLAGGLLLLWVSWKMYRQLKSAHVFAPLHESNASEPVTAADRKSLRNAVIQIIVADVSMSLDNVLGVAGAAREHTWVLIFGLALSVVLMGVAATAVVRLLHRFRWLGYAGLLVVLYVALRLILDGSHEVSQQLAMLT